MSPELDRLLFVKDHFYKYKWSNLFFRCSFHDVEKLRCSEMYWEMTLTTEMQPVTQEESIAFSDAPTTILEV